MKNDYHTFFSPKGFSAWLLFSFLLCSAGTFSGFVAESYAAPWQQVTIELIVSPVTAGHRTISVAQHALFVSEGGSLVSKRYKRLALRDQNRLICLQLHSTSRKLLDTALPPFFCPTKIRVASSEEDSSHLC